LEINQQSIYRHSARLTGRCRWRMREMAKVVCQADEEDVVTVDVAGCNGLDVCSTSEVGDKSLRTAPLHPPVDGLVSHLGCASGFRVPQHVTNTPSAPAINLFFVFRTASGPCNNVCWLMTLVDRTCDSTILNGEIGFDGMKPTVQLQ
uniref:ZP domain-containing protein n=1 Tax=Taenia asiatica TaxID=60517 RepID=A0A0R3VXF3_TAEAS